MLISKYKTASNSTGKTSPLDIHKASLSMTRKNLNRCMQDLWTPRSYIVVEYLTGNRTVQYRRYCFSSQDSRVQYERHYSAQETILYSTGDSTVWYR